MLSILLEFTRKSDVPRTVIVMEEGGVEQPRQYRVLPRRLWLGLGGGALALALLLVGCIAFTPLREWIPGYSSDAMRRDARLTTLRLNALQDSLVAQQRYMAQLRHLLTGQVDSTFMAEATASPEPAPAVSGPLAEVAAEAGSKNWADHEQPAVPIVQMPAAQGGAYRAVSAGTPSLAGLQLPAVPPVNGFITRGFDARSGHYGVDFAVKEGTMVRSVGDGHVILADWTYEGGNAIAVQHADGYVSVYKHNQRLLKRVGDRVRAREAVAISGNSGEITTGPHLHFEFWLNGLAQDPQNLFIGE